MHFEHTSSPPQSAGVELDWETSLSMSKVDVAKANGLLSELRHLLENGCTLTTALDLLEQAQQTLNGERPSIAQAQSEKVEILNLSRLLDDALGNSAIAIK